MNYDKFDDPVALLIDLCRPMNSNEKVLLGALGYKFSKDQKFRKEYLYSLKRFYMKNFQDMKSKKYVLRSFAELNKELESSMEKDGKTLNLMPAYAAFDPHEEDKAQSAKERAQILRELLQKKKR